MKKILWILPLALFALSCGGDDVKMPWEDDLGKGEQQKPQPEPENPTPDNPNTPTVEVGDTLTAWSEGELDIHTISTGRGECLFFILPDGTTMVVDAGEFSRETSEYKNVLQRPNATVRPTKIYGDYIKHFLPRGKSAIDYMHISHFHMDHMGNLEKEYTKDETGTYTLAGVTALYHHIPFIEVIDRAYGNYDGLKVNSMSEAALANYRKFTDYHVGRNALRASQFKLGAVNQFAMKYNAAAYPNFRIENVCANCCIWKNNQSVDIYAQKGAAKAENAASCGFVIRYGDFDFLTAGDIGDYYDYEYAVAEVVGQVEATKAHHHLSPHSNREKAQNVLKPQVLVATSFYVRKEQPDKDKFGYITEGGCDIYCTSVGESLIEQYPLDYIKCNATSGHIVIRVAKGGESFMVYTLDDMNSEYKVKRIDGPYYNYK
ncbi:MAG: hypothetical protein IJB23_01280 [Alistipes sp.]|nr:hypothetical protein [Alistipes sp.]MBQ9963085.1 hypothetical protein [Alistipes sp.]